MKHSNKKKGNQLLRLYVPSISAANELSLYENRLKLTGNEITKIRFEALMKGYKTILMEHSSNDYDKVIDKLDVTISESEITQNLIMSLIKMFFMATNTASNKDIFKDFFEKITDNKLLSQDDLASFRRYDLKNVKK